MKNFIELLEKESKEKTNKDFDLDTFYTKHKISEFIKEEVNNSKLKSDSNKASKIKD